MAAAAAALLALTGVAGLCFAQTALQGAANPPPQPDHTGGVLEIAPRQAAPVPADNAATPEPQIPPVQPNNDEQGGENDVELYRMYTDSDHAAGRSGPLPYLGVSVHSTTMVQSDGTQQRALEVLSVDKGSPAEAAGLRGSGAPTKVGASTLTASALLGPAQELMAPLLQKTGQLGHQGDLIVAVDDNRVGSEQDLAGELAKLKPGDTMWLTVLRACAKGRPRAVKIAVRLAPPQNAAR